MSIYKSAVLCIIAMLLNQSAIADNFKQSQSEFEAYKNQSTVEYIAVKDEFAEYKQQLLSAFDSYRKSTSSIWGAKNNRMPDRKIWVSYQGDLSHRSVVDFEKGTVDVEIAIPDSQSVSDLELRQQLEDAIANTMKQGADTRSIIDIAKSPVSRPVGEAVLRDQVADEGGRKISESDYRRLAVSLAANPERKKITGDDGQSRVIYTARFSLVPDHIKVRAIRYEAEVNKNAKVQQMPSALIYAVMETESMFNPTARSPAPAFGLMQLVPNSGARDAYRHVYDADRVVTDTYLYNPANNIILGSAYLNLLYYNYLSGIQNEQSRQWSTIAAYNTGAGNVFNAFAGNYSTTRFSSRSQWRQIALNEINRRSPDEVYDFLRKNLTYEEARNYVKLVRERMTKYQPG